MSFGLPYMGSKNIYAKQICDALPSGKRLVDLFAGGCAITDCALKLFSKKWNTFLINDIDNNPIDLYVKCLCDKNNIQCKWITRDAFNSADWTTRLIWSFGSQGLRYMYGKELEPIKHDIESWIIDGVVLNNSNILCNIDLPNLDSIEARYNYWKIKRKYISKVLNISADRLRPNYIEHILRMKNIECKQCVENIELSYKSYEQYEYHEGDVVYCDIPYKFTDCRQYKSTEFNHKLFWDWASSQPFDVYVSERTVPDNAEIIFTKQVPSRASHIGCDSFKTEFLVKV